MKKISVISIVFILMLVSLVYAQEKPYYGEFTGDMSDVVIEDDVFKISNRETGKKETFKILQVASTYNDFKQHLSYVVIDDLIFIVWDKGNKCPTTGAEAVLTDGKQMGLFNRK